MKPIISIVTVNLNNADFLVQTIESVAAQDYPFKEYIVVDGLSTDGSMDIIRESSAINQFISEKDSGIYDAMNKGLKHCTADSDLVIFMNAGDRFTTDSILAEVAAHYRQDDQHLYGDIIKGQEYWPSPKKVNKMTLSSDMVCHQAIFFNTHLHRTVQYDTNYRLCSDYKAILSMLDQGQKFRRIPVTVANFDDSGLSSLHRRKLKEEKAHIRQSFPQVQWMHKIKKLLRKIR